MIDEQIGFLKVIRRGVYSNSSEKRAYWICLCICGKEVGNFGYTLRRGKVKSCGCKKNEIIGNNRRTHGLTNTPEYSIWQGIKHRCFLPNEVAYKDYGGRGIDMCERWKNSFENFLSDMGNRPSNKHTIDRINFNGNYEPSNCRWATKEVQANNTRTNFFYKYNGKILTWAQWSRETGIKQHTLAARFRSGKSGHEIFSKINHKTKCPVIISLRILPI